jgi:methylenetetrahydrofolate reductase (NADPH)
MIMKYSFEFFPPNSPEGLEKLKLTARQLKRHEPEYYSVTFGAGGVTRDKSLTAVRLLLDEGHVTAPHISCMSASAKELSALLTQYASWGVNRLVALRGDLPSGAVSGGELRYASDLVKFIRKEFGNHFYIEVACYPEIHPQAKNAATDLTALRTKFEHGANEAVTQFFYNGEAFADFYTRVRAAGISQPITPGIMPIRSFAAVTRFAEGCGAEIPRWIERQMQSLGDDAVAVRDLGLKIVTQLSQNLIDSGQPSLHFYTLNQADLSSAVIDNLRPKSTT